jgi:hypothetical protein
MGSQTNLGEQGEAKTPSQPRVFLAQPSVNMRTSTTPLEQAHFHVEEFTLPVPPPASACNSHISVIAVRQLTLSDLAALASDSDSQGSQRSRREVATQAAQSCEAPLPVVIWLHATGASAASMMSRLLAYANMGFLAVAMDCRYHGKRSNSTEAESQGTYEEAVFRCVPCSGEQGVHCSSSAGFTT